MLVYLKKIKSGLEFSKELVLTALLAVLWICFIISHNEVPSGSMIPTIQEGDHLLTNMIPYYYSDPKYGEIVVFRRPSGEAWVKRVIGLPGDEMDIREGKVYQNGKLLDESAYLDAAVSSTPSELVQIEDRIMAPVTFPYTVPDGCYFLMGDNREESGDCRYLGAIKREDIYGKAWIKVYPFSEIGFLK